MQYSAVRRHRMHRVANYIRNNLSEPMDLEQLAKTACLSKFQFIRAFSEHYRETPINYLWRLRLEYGARKLVFENQKSITSIAMNFGFASSQNFSGSFSRRFGVAPSIFRFNNLNGFMSREQANLSPYKIATKNRENQHVDRNPFTIRIKKHSAIRMAYVRYIGSYWDSNSSIAFEQLEMWARKKGLWDTVSHMIGICPDNSGVTPDGHCTYDACLPVPDNIQEDDTVSIQTIPAGTYAIMGVDPDTNIKDAWMWFFTGWIKAHGAVYDFAQPYERYPIAKKQWVAKDQGLELCIRLKALL